MSDVLKAARINAEVAAARIAADGMLAENEHRTRCGNSIAYGDEAFDALCDKLNNRVAAILAETASADDEIESIAWEIYKADRIHDGVAYFENAMNEAKRCIADRNAWRAANAERARS